MHLSLKGNTKHDLCATLAFRHAVPSQLSIDLNIDDIIVNQLNNFKKAVNPMGSVALKCFEPDFKS